MTDIKEMERILKALANRRRIMLVWVLKEKSPTRVGDLSEKIKLSFKATSNHLAVLRAADIVEREQVGLIMNYRLAPSLHPLVKIVAAEAAKHAS